MNKEIFLHGLIFAILFWYCTNSGYIQLASWLNIKQHCQNPCSLRYNPTISVIIKQQNKILHQTKGLRSYKCSYTCYLAYVYLHQRSWISLLAPGSCANTDQGKNISYVVLYFTINRKLVIMKLLLLPQSKGEQVLPQSKGNTCSLITFSCGGKITENDTLN